MASMREAGNGRRASNSLALIVRIRGIKNELRLMRLTASWPIAHQAFDGNIIAAAYINKNMKAIGNRRYAAWRDMW